MGRPSSRKALELAPVLGQINPVLSFDNRVLRQTLGWASKSPGVQDTLGQSGLSWTLVALGMGASMLVWDTQGPRTRGKTK